MRDAFGGIFNFVIIIVFLVVVTGYLAFNVNYTKAFRVKNKAITTIEQYEGSCSDSSPCRAKIKEYADSLGYAAYDPDVCDGLDDDDCFCKDGVCIEKITTPAAGDLKAKHYYKVTTATAIDMPMIKAIMPKFQIFQISGATKTFVS